MIENSIYLQKTDRFAKVRKKEKAMLLRELLTKYELNNDKNHAEVALEVGVSLSTYYRWMNGESTKLKKGTIKKLSEVLEVDVQKVLDEQERFKPLIGVAKAGYDMLIDENIEDYLELGQSDASKGDYFLRVKGDSMEQAHIFDGDLIYVRACDSVKSGQIAVILIGDEVTIKKVIYKNDLMILEAQNPKYESRYFTLQELDELPVKILGLVLFARRDFAV